MRQAIVTKYIGPTNFKGSRVKAKCEAGQLTMAWNPGLDSDENHTFAAEELARKLGWFSPRVRLHGGALPRPGSWDYCFVLEWRK